MLKNEENTDNQKESTTIEDVTKAIVESLKQVSDRVDELNKTVLNLSQSLEKSNEDYKRKIMVAASERPDAYSSFKQDDADDENPAESALNKINDDED